MATVRMIKGSKYADIFDSPETIKQAQLDGYSLVEKKASVPEKPALEKSDEEAEKHRVGRPPKQQ